MFRLGDLPELSIGAIPVAQALCTAGTPGEFCIRSINCSQNRGHSPGWCEPRSTGKDS